MEVASGGDCSSAFAVIEDRRFERQVHFALLPFDLGWPKKVWANESG